MMNALPAPPTSGTMFTQIGKRCHNGIDDGGVPSYAMIYAEQTGPKTMLLDGSWSMAWAHDFRLGFRRRHYRDRKEGLAYLCLGGKLYRYAQGRLPRLVRKQA